MQVRGAFDQELIVVGRLVAAQGLDGALRVLPLSDFPERFTVPGCRWLQKPCQPPVPVQLHNGRLLHGKHLFVIRLVGVERRDAAEALVGAEILAAASDRPPLGPGEFHLLDLQGLQVRELPTAKNANVQNCSPYLGTVADLQHAGHDLLEVETLT